MSETFALTRPVHVEHVHLNVIDLPMVSGFYQRIIGLSVIEASASREVLGVAGRPLLTLSAGKGFSRAPRSAAGLFHTAFLVPNRAALADWLAHAADETVKLEGASDHLVSEALYLSDPEGNGIEIYRDRAPEEWTYRDDGTVEMATERLDLRALHDEAQKTGWRGMPDGTAIGHIHLQVGDVPQAEAFYRDVLGLKVMARYTGASFFASGGYHHHIAANIWNSRGAGLRQEGMAGLEGYTLRFNDAAGLEIMLQALDGLRIGVSRDADGYALKDPWGTRLRLVG